MSQRARDALARATPQNQSKAKKADAAKNSREERLADRNNSKTAHASQAKNDSLCSADKELSVPRRRSKPSQGLESERTRWKHRVLLFLRLRAATN